MREEITCIVSGRVQMVMYRDFAQRKARSLGIVGTVKNLSNGTVEVVAQGTPDQLKQYIEKLHEGSILSKVEDVAVDWHSSRTTYDDFTIRYT
jgi:acylphosphatase